MYSAITACRSRPAYIMLHDFWFRSVSMIVIVKQRVDVKLRPINHAVFDCVRAVTYEILLYTYRSNGGV